MKRFPRKSLRRQPAARLHTCQHCGHRYNVRQSKSKAPYVFCRVACELRFILAEITRGFSDDRSGVSVAA